MKKVIKGKLYNTDTATLLGKYANEYGNTDFNYIRESLYRTKSRAYFIHGEGGGLTMYAVSAGNNTWCGGEKIIPMSREAAREWAEKNLEIDDYIATFGSPDDLENGEDREKLDISLSLRTIRKLEILSEETGDSISQIIEERFAEN